MKIVMFTNTYLPHVGGVANSVATLARLTREQGHQVHVVAPEFDETSGEEEDVIRVPALQNFNGSDFSVSLALPPAVTSRLKAVEPDLIHSHHPFLLGDSALRLSTSLQVPLLFTHHTRYEYYTHYVPLEAVELKKIAIEMAVTYCQMCDHVIAPSRSVEQILQERGVETPITSIPTGVDLDRFARGDGAAARRRLAIPKEAFVVGHVGRLAPEKNCEFLARCVAAFLKANPKAFSVVVGSGPARDPMRKIGQEAGVDSRMKFLGTLQGGELADAYHAFDLFAFASKSETQGMVLAESMSAGVPVVALDAPGAREVVEDGKNGCLVREEREEDFIRALDKVARLSPQDHQTWSEKALETAQGFAEETCAGRVVEVYRQVLDQARSTNSREQSAWDNLLTRVSREWTILSRNVSVLKSALSEQEKGSGDAGR